MSRTLMTAEAIQEYILAHFADTVAATVWGETAFFYNPASVLPRGVYFATLKEQDGANDRASHLNRPGTYRLNIGVSRSTYEQHFGKPPERPTAGGVVATGHDFTRVGELLPHPVYAWMGWVGILNPEEDAFDRVKPLLAEAYTLAVHKFEKRLKSRK
ncbi:MAG: DUF6194 family protein [Armatimonadaceae bacterium]